MEKHNSQGITHGDDMNRLIEELRNNEFAIIKRSNNTASHKLLTLAELKKISDRNPEFFENNDDVRMSIFGKSDDFFFRIFSQRKSFYGQSLMIAYLEYSLYYHFSYAFHYCSFFIFDSPFVKIVLNIVTLWLVTKLFFRHTILSLMKDPNIDFKN